MAFQFYSSVISQASKRVAGGIFSTGLALIGFGVLIYLLPKFFAAIAAIFFFIIGLGACVTAFKIFISQHAIDKQMHNEAFAKSHVGDEGNESDDYRRNVRIKIE